MTKLQKLQQSIPDKIDAVLITSEVNRQYFLGFHSSAGVLLVTRNNALFIIDFRYYEKAKKLISDCGVVLMERFEKQVCRFFKQESAYVVAVESAYMTLQEFYRYQGMFQEYNFTRSNTLDETIQAMRSCKTPDEIEAIAAAQAITDRAYHEILNHIRVGVTEKQVATELEYAMKRFGADGFAFDTIVVSGSNSSLPHGTPGDKPLERGDFVTMDFGARLGGYNSDMTRTVGIGAVSEEQKQVYQTVLTAQQMALEAIREDISCFQIDKIARDYINGQGYEGCFGHGLGHSVGIEIHENPSFNTRDTTLTENGMVITVEPGIYLEGKFGVRIEDMIVVEGSGCRNLTASPKDLVCL